MDTRTYTHTHTHTHTHCYFQHVREPKLRTLHFQFLGQRKTNKQIKIYVSYLPKMTNTDT